MSLTNEEQVLVSLKALTGSKIESQDRRECQRSRKFVAQKSKVSKERSPLPARSLTGVRLELLAGAKKR